MPDVEDALAAVLLAADVHTEADDDGVYCLRVARDVLASGLVVPAPKPLPADELPPPELVEPWRDWINAIPNRPYGQGDFEIAMALAQAGLEPPDG